MFRRITSIMNSSFSKLPNIILVTGEEGIVNQDELAVYLHTQGYITTIITGRNMN